MGGSVNKRPLRDAGANLQIVPLSKEFISSCSKIVAETELWHHYGIDYDRAFSMFSTAFESGEHIFVAVLDGDVVGFVWIVPRGMFGRSGYIKLIGVAPQMRGHGIGGALLSFAEDELSKYDRDVFLLVSHFNSSAIKFYKKMGYVEVGRLPDYAVKGITEILMWKRLTGRALS